MSSQPPIHFLTPEQLKHSRAFLEMSFPKVFYWFLYGTLLLLLVGALYAALGKMEVVVKAPALLRTQANVSEIKSEVTAQVASFSVAHGDPVGMGAVLLTLDQRVWQSNLETVTKEHRRLSQLLAEYLWVQKKLENLPTGRGTPEAHRRANIILNEEQRLGILAEQARKEWEMEQQVPASSRAVFRLDQLESAYRLSLAELTGYQLQQRQALQHLVAETQTRLQDLARQAAQLRAEADSLVLRAPISGQVEILTRFNPGDILAAGQTILRIVPTDARQLRVELSIAANDIALVRAGQTLRLLFPKLSASEYGSLAGVVETVPQDAWLLPNQGPVFTVTGTLERNWMTNRLGEKVFLVAGMQAEAQVIVRKKPIWLFILQKLDFVR